MVRQNSKSTAASQTADDIQSIAFVSLGCPKNLVDSEKMLGLLAEDGIAITGDHEQADAIIINTCGFLEASKTESIDVIREAINEKIAAQQDGRNKRKRGARSRRMGRWIELEQGDHLVEGQRRQRRRGAATPHLPGR